jgi:hypothetical protein
MVRWLFGVVESIEAGQVAVARAYLSEMLLVAADAGDCDGWQSLETELPLHYDCGTPLQRAFQGLSKEQKR